MPIDPNIYSQIQQPNMLQTITSGLQAGNALSDMSYKRTQRDREEAAYPQKLADEKSARLFAIQTQIGGVLTKLQESIAMGNVSDDAIKQQAMKAKEYGLPDYSIQQTFDSYLQIPAENRAKVALRHVTKYDEWFKGETTRRGQDITAETSRLKNAASNAARNAPNLSSDLLIPGEDGTLVPNSALIDVRTKIAQAGASQNVNMGAPQIAINPKTGKPEYVQFGNRPGTPPKFSGVTPAPNVGGRGGSMSPVVQKEIISTDDEIQGSLAAKVGLKNALDLNDKAMGFAGAGALSTAGTLLPQSIRPDAVDATENLQNIIVSNVLPQLKSTFGGMPTEGERKILIDVQGSVSRSPAVRKAIFERAQKAIDTRLKFAKEKAKSLREGSYFQSDEGVTSIITPPAEVSDRPIDKWEDL